MSQLSAVPSRGALRAPLRSPMGAIPLRVVSGRAARSSGSVFAVLCALALAAGLLVLLLLNTSIAQRSFVLHDLQRTAANLSDRQDALRQQLTLESAPAVLARRAAAMGMVPAQSAAFLRLPDGAVLGVASRAQAGQRFTVVTATKPPKRAARTGSSRSLVVPGTSTMTTTTTKGATTTRTTVTRAATKAGGATTTTLTTLVVATTSKPSRTPAGRTTTSSRTTKTVTTTTEKAGVTTVVVTTVKPDGATTTSRTTTTVTKPTTPGKPATNATTAAPRRAPAAGGNGTRMPGTPRH